MSDQVTANEATDVENREPSHVSLTGLLGVSSRWIEEMVVTPPAGMENWKMWRVVYSLPDGSEREYAIMLPPETDPRKLTRTLQADDVEWIVNDNAELGVRIHGQCFFLYKGDSLVYDEACHDDGSPMYVRTVGKREFGECCHPLNHADYRMKGTVSLDDCDRWEMMV